MSGGIGMSDYAATLSGLSLGSSLGNFQMAGVSEMQALNDQGLSNQVGKSCNSMMMLIKMAYGLEAIRVGWWETRLVEHFYLIVF
jgi:hypothetical protein